MNTINVTRNHAYLTEDADPLVGFLGLKIRSDVGTTVVLVGGFQEGSAELGKGEHLGT